MKGFYNKAPALCYRADRLFFRKMQIGMNPDHVWVRTVNIGDVIKLKDEVIAKWRIVDDGDGKHYLGYITDNYFWGSGKWNIYVVAPSNNPQNPHWALYRIKSKSNVAEIVKLFK